MMAAWPLNKINCGKAVLLAGMVVAAVWMTYPYLVESSVPARPLKPAAPKPAGGDNQPMPKGFGQPPVICDPFRMSSAVLPLAATGSSRSAPVPTIPYRLTGIAIGNQAAAVILESKEGSRSYRIGDYAGQYQIREITPASVLIVGPDGSHLLNLKRGIQ